MPGTWTALRSLDARLIWALLGLPLCIWAGVLWDSFQAPREVQSFLGASNNLYLLWLMPVVLKDLLVLWLRGLPRLRPLAVGSFLLVSWVVWGLALHGRFDSVKSSVVPLVAVLCIGAAVVLWDAAHGAWKNGQGPDLQKAFQGVSIWALAGLLTGAIVHLLGAWPERQIFLYVDGFANIRTFGETASVFAAVALATALVQGGHFWRVAAVLAIAALAWSGTRAGWVGLAGALFFASFFWGRPFVRGVQAAALLALGFALSVPVPTPDGSYGAFRVGHLLQETQNAASTLQRMDEIPGEEAIEGSNRLALWNWGMDRVAESPWTGMGYGSMGSIPDKPAHAHFMHLHNLPLDLAFGMGIPVALFLVGLLLASAFSAALRARWDGLWALPLASFTVLLTSLFAGLFLFPITVAVAVLGLGGAWVGRAVAPDMDSTTKNGGADAGIVDSQDRGQGNPAAPTA